MGQKMGIQSIAFCKDIRYIAGYAIAGKKESEGPLGEEFDATVQDDLFGEESFEKAERKMFRTAMEGAVRKAGLTLKDIDLVIGGDLLNQIISASFAVKDFEGGYIGVYGACSTMALSLLVGANMIESGAARRAVCATSSHFCTAERQYRFPLEMGDQRTPTAQWTVSGSGAAVIAEGGEGLRITGGTFGTVVDMGIDDANNMGAAMAPAAADTISTYMKEHHCAPEDFDMILTGDLGQLGKSVLADLLAKKGYDVQGKLQDCGCMIFSQEQDTHMGGSGCGCSAVVLNSRIYHKMCAGELKKVLFVATGALLSQTSSMQGDSIPGIAHAVCIEK